MKAHGFTLIELVVVIVLLGLLSATALPRFVDLSGDANQSAVDAYAGALTSAYSINYAERAISALRGVAITGTTTATICTPILDRMVPPSLPAAYTMQLLTGDCTDGAGSLAQCQIVKSGKTATASAICTGV